jgi:rhamnulose-1-phosphate aldolase
MRELLPAIAETAALLEQRGWCERNAGNFSLLLDPAPKIPEEWESSIVDLPVACTDLAGCTLLISAAGSRMRDIARQPQDHLLVMSILDDAQARLFRPKLRPSLQPSSELPTHLKAHTALISHKPGQNALVHAHVTQLIQLSHHPGAETEEGFNGILLRVHPETLYFLPDGCGLVPFQLPGTSELAEMTAEKIITHDVIVWERHGALACGPDLREAFDRLDIASRAADIFLGCKRAGFSPRTFSEEEYQGLITHYQGMKQDNALRLEEDL